MNANCNSLNFGFCHINVSPSKEYREFVETLNELGFNRVWLPDQDFLHDPFVTAGSLAVVDADFEIGIGITSPMLRHPVTIARAAATLATHLGNRFLLGLGTGNIQSVLKPTSTMPARPFQHFQRSIGQISSLLSGDSTIFAPGEEPVRLDISTERKVPLYVGARGPKMLELAGKVADGVLIESRAAGSSFKEAATRVCKGMERNESPPGSRFDMGIWQVIKVTDDAERVYNDYRTWIARMIKAGPASAMAMAGVSSRTLDRVKVAKSSHEIAEIGAMLSVEECRAIVIAGTPSEVSEQLKPALAHGATSVNLVGGGTLEESTEVASRFASEVVPLIEQF